MFGSRNDVFLQFRMNEFEHLREPSDPHHKIAILLGVLLRLTQSLDGGHVPLELANPHSDRRLDQFRQCPDTRVAFHESGVNLDDRG